MDLNVVVTVNKTNEKILTSIGLFSAVLQGTNNMLIDGFFRTAKRVSVTQGPFHSDMQSIEIS